AFGAHPARILRSKAFVIEDIRPPMWIVLGGVDRVPNGLDWLAEAPSRQEVVVSHTTEIFVTASEPCPPGASRLRLNETRDKPKLPPIVVLLNSITAASYARPPIQIRSPAVGGISRREWRAARGGRIAAGGALWAGIFACAGSADADAVCAGFGERA